MGPASIPAIERFWRHVVKLPGEDACWPWTGGTRNGYGIFFIGMTEDGKRQFTTAHRFAYVTYVGPIPDGLSVLHHCDNPPCCRYDKHLFPGTKQENMDDKVAKGRQAFGVLHGMTQMSEADVLEIRAARLDGVSGVALAERFGVTPQAIYAIEKRKTWKHI